MEPVENFFPDQYFPDQYVLPDELVFIEMIMLGGPRQR